MSNIIKTCKTCGSAKPIEDFKKEPRGKDGYTPHCKVCINQKKKLHRKNNHSHYLELEFQRRNHPDVKKYLKQWWEEHRDEQHDKARQRYEKNREPYLKRAKEQRARDPEGYRTYIRKWHRENKKWNRDYYYNVHKKDINWRIRNTLRGSLRKALNGKNKTCSVLKYLGCSLDFFKGYLEAKFQKGMTWENYGKIWHMDHIRPCVSFDMQQESEREKCFHYSNLQPLLASENCAKGDRMPDGTSGRKLLTRALKSL